jgi:hypothetical protein
MSHAEMERQTDPDLRPADVEEADWDAADVIPAPETTQDEIRYEQELDDAEASIGLGDSTDPSAPRDQPESG